LKVALHRRPPKLAGGAPRRNAIYNLDLSEGSRLWTGGRFDMGRLEWSCSAGSDNAVGRPSCAAVSRLALLIAAAPYVLLAAGGLKFGPAHDQAVLNPGFMPLIVALLAATFLGEHIAAVRKCSRPRNRMCCHEFSRSRQAGLLQPCATCRPANVAPMWPDKQRSVEIGRQVNVLWLVSATEPLKLRYSPLRSCICTGWHDG
jgi:hypothetical protein